MTANAAVKLRADATRNRERIIVAAREALLEHGVDAPLDEIAKRAGVGNATVYRHFADRQELALQVALSVMDRLTRRAEEALAQEPDAFDALRRFVHEAADERVGALCPMLSTGFGKGDPRLEESRIRLEHAIEELLAAGRRIGRLRSDIDVGDVMVAVSQLTRPLPGMHCGSMDRFVRRHLQLFVDGLQASASSELPGQSVTFDDLRQCR
ncbi:TetR/AcrR family transcriptional regulator [Actinacidiphila sp. bgisy167]|uniref:TetR/AcrR family transcriptional regulator n=1 Tax=Actinacidiphila sp. bgisy167 TaxID=3413797 RepID=UPI003D70D37F